MSTDDILDIVTSLRAEVERLIVERDAARQYAVTMEDMATRCKHRREEDAGEISRLKSERDAIIDLCVTKHGTAIWRDLVGNTGCDDPAEAVRTAAGLARSGGDS